MEDYFGSTWLVRLLFERGLAVVYFVAFVSSLAQFPALLGERGLLPTPDYVRRVPFRASPSLFHFHYSDRAFRALALTGTIVSAVLVSGVTELWPAWSCWVPWFVLWVFYLSIVNVGQLFYGFGWESMLLEAGFFAMFLGPRNVEPSVIPVLALRWMLFRTELGAGLIKIRHDSCWRDLTCLYYHYETQPLPNPLSWRFHHLPRRIHRLGVLFSHLVQLVLPYGLFFPQPIAAGVGALIIVHQLLLIVSGNYGWLNWLTVVLGLSAFDDTVLGALTGLQAPPLLAPRPAAYDIVLYMLAGCTLILSLKPALNLISKRQRMNFSYNPLHIVNSYGAFGQVTRERHEVVVEGMRDEQSGWREYEFRAKPGDVKRRPPWIAPYQLRLDWLVWFLSLRGGFGSSELWFERFIERLLAADAPTLRLLRRDPFAGAQPRSVRATLYRYRFTSARQRKETGAFWTREPIGELLRVDNSDGR
jgi:hypothetical protein